MTGNDLQETDGLATGGSRARLATGLFVAIAFLMAIDLAGDAHTGAEASHLLVEAAAMGLASAGVVALWREWRQAEALADRLHSHLEAARLEARQFRDESKQLLRGLGEAIDRQFERWQLTPAEREVGLLLLKGLSHREVAAVRATAEITVRQHALSVYRKSGLRNRSELSAFFLEDLLLPTDEA